MSVVADHEDRPVTEVSGSSSADDIAPADWKPPRGYVLAVAVLVAIGVGLGVLTLMFASRAAEDHDREVEQTASRFGTALLTYDYQKLEESKARVLSFATGGFKKQYEQAFAGGLDVLWRETQAKSVVTDMEVFVSDVEDSTASAIVVMDTVTEGKSGARRTLDAYVRLELVKVAGEWKVDAVINLNFGRADVPGGSTTTAAPAPSE